MFLGAAVAAAVAAVAAVVADIVVDVAVAAAAVVKLAVEIVVGVAVEIVVEELLGTVAVVGHPGNVVVELVPGIGLEELDPEYCSVAPGPGIVDQVVVAETVPVVAVEDVHLGTGLAVDTAGG